MKELQRRRKGKSYYKRRKRKGLERVKKQKKKPKRLVHQEDKIIRRKAANYKLINICFIM